MATKILKTKFQIRQDTAANWSSKNPTLASGEIAFDTTNKKFKIGDGSTKWNSLAYAPNLTKADITTALGYTPPTKDTTYSAATVSAAGLMSAADKSKLDNIAAGAEVNVQSDWNATSGDAFIKNKPSVYNKSEIDSLLAGMHETLENKASTSHSHDIATSSKLGFVKSATTGTTANRDYNVQIKSDGTMKVNVPWLAYTDATQSKSGLMNASDKTKLDGITAEATRVTTETVAGWGYTKNAGTVTSVKVGSTSYSPSSGIVSLPSYPTSLPASDVYSWAKASTKPTYTASEVGLGNVGNFKAVSTVASQGLSTTEKSNARANIGAGTSSFSGSYTDLSNKPDIPSGAAASKGVDTSISASSTSTNLPTSKAVAAFVEGKGYKTTDNNTTYSFATGDSNGQIKVTPSGGTAQNISVKGLGSAAYKASSDFAAASHGTHVSYGGNGSATTVSRSDHTHSGYATSGHTHGVSMTATTSEADVTLKPGDKFTLTAGGSNMIFRLAAFADCLKADNIPSLPSSRINAMTGYSKASSASAIATTDSLNTAIGKLEKALDGKGTSNLSIGTTATTAAAGNHTHNYLSTNGGTVSGNLAVTGTTKSTGLITQGSPSSDNTITSMNRFAADLFVSGNGSAPNAPKVAGFYLGKSASDENRHMDIVSGADYSYIDFNKASNVVDYQARCLVNVTTGNIDWQWDGAATDKTFNISGGTLRQNGVNVSLEGHTHTGYASSTHNHDNAYAAKDHGHSGYAASSHNHDDKYVKKVKIGSDEAYGMNTSGIVELPAYPTSLPASDVYAWAKAATKPTYSKSDIGLGNVGNFKAVSTVASQGLTDTEKSNARANIGAGTSNLTLGTTSTTAAKGDHTHSGMATQTWVTNQGYTKLTIGTTSSTAAAGNHTHSGYATSTHDHDARYVQKIKIGSSEAYEIDGSGVVQLPAYPTGGTGTDAKTTSGSKTGAKQFIVTATSQSTSGITTYSHPGFYIDASNRLYAPYGTTGTTGYPVVVNYTASTYGTSYGNIYGIKAISQSNYTSASKNSNILYFVI